MSTPFNLEEQFMAVIPADSSHAIPKAVKWLMTNLESPISDFYPTSILLILMKRLCLGFKLYFFHL